MFLVFAEFPIVFLGSVSPFLQFLLGSFDVLDCFIDVTDRVCPLFFPTHHGTPSPFSFLIICWSRLSANIVSSSQPDWFFSRDTVSYKCLKILVLFRNCSKSFHPRRPVFSDVTVFAFTVDSMGNIIVWSMRAFGAVRFFAFDILCLFCAWLTAFRAFHMIFMGYLHLLRLLHNC